MRKKLAILFLLPLLLFFIPKNLDAATDHVVISEVQIAGTNGSDEFVELYNPTASSIDMAGWKLTRKNSEGTEANLVLSMSGTIPSHGYFLIGHGTGYDGSTALDLSYSAASNALTNSYTVLLYSDAGITLVDKVGFGAGLDFENTVFPSNPAANGSIERKPGESDPLGGNGTDTNDNSSDFSLRTVSEPQNSLSAIEPPPATPSPTATASPTSTASPTEEPTASPTATPTVTPTEAPTSSPTASPSPSPSPTPSPSPSPSPTPSPTASPSPSPNPSPTPTEEPETPTATPTAISTSTTSPSATPVGPTPTPSGGVLGWLKSPVFTCQNPHIPQFVYNLLKFIMTWKFNC